MPSRRLVLSALCVLFLAITALAATTTTKKPIVIAHRGASGERPEHTLAAYELALVQNADYLECDLQVSSDKQLVCLHDLELSVVTDVASRAEFASRRTSKRLTPTGSLISGWFADDFTLAELRSLRSNQRFAFRAQKFNGIYGIVSFSEFLLFIDAFQVEASPVNDVDNNAETPAVVGMYIETKYPSYYQRNNVSVNDLLLSALTEHQWCVQAKTATDTCRLPQAFIQSFETTNLINLKSRTNIPLVQLIDNADVVQADTGRLFAELTTNHSLTAIATYAAAIGPSKLLLFNQTTDSNGNFVATATPLIANAHALKLGVHAWTFRNESQYYNSKFAENMKAEIVAYLKAGCDGVFSDYPLIAFAAREFVSPTRSPVYNATVIGILVNIGVCVASIVGTLIVLFVVKFVRARTDSIKALFGARPSTKKGIRLEAELE